MNPPGHLAAIVAAVKAAAPELGGRVWSGSAPLDPGFPYAVVSGPAETITPHSNRTGHVNALIEVSVFATTSAEASALQWRVGPGVRKPDVAAGVHADYSVDGWGWTGTVALEWRSGAPNGSRVYRRALSFRLILTPKGTLR